MAVAHAKVIVSATDLNVYFVFFFFVFFLRGGVLLLL